MQEAVATDNRSAAQELSIRIGIATGDATLEDGDLFGRPVIEAAENPMALWIELLGQCQDAYKKQDEAMIGRFYDYARWCWQSRIDDVVTAVACAFYEHLPRTRLYGETCHADWSSRFQ